MKLLPVGAVVLAVLAGAAPAQPQPARPASSASHCAAEETVIYSCAFGRKHASVCGAPGRVAYRFGRLGRPEIAIASAPDWKNIHTGRITGGGGGYQNHVRFTVANHDYVVFEAVAGELTEVPGKRWSGVYVQRGEKHLATLTCGRERTTAGDLRLVEDLAPANARDSLEEDDPRFEAWF